MRGLLLVAFVASCGGVGGTPAAPGIPGTAARCRVGSTQTSLLVTEWPAAEKANMEALWREGAVAVEFSGCAMRVLPECRLYGAYDWQRTTPSTDIVEIRDESELYAKLPLGAVSLSGELNRSGTLYVETVVSGQLRLRDMYASQVPSTHECARATHLVNAVSLGAFVLSAGGQVTDKGSIGGYGAEAGGSYTRSAKIVRYAGNADACTATGETAPADCASPIQVFLEPIPGRAEIEGPPGSVKVDFVSGSATARWDVYVDDEATCTTPCARWVDPTRPLALRVRDGTDRLRVGELTAAGGPVQVVASPTSRGKLATGITFTSLGGMAVITGITLMGVGCSDDDREGMCDAGMITGAAGAVVTIGGVWLIRAALPRLQVRPIFAGNVVVGPGFVAGSF